jgi:hypothetical protein
MPVSQYTYTEVYNEYLYFLNKIIDQINNVLFDYNAKYSYYNIYTNGYALPDSDKSDYNTKLTQVQRDASSTLFIMDDLIDGLDRSGNLPKVSIKNSYKTDISKCQANINYLKTNINGSSLTHLVLPYPIDKSTTTSGNIDPKVASIEASLYDSLIIVNNVYSLSVAGSTNLNIIFSNFNNDINASPTLPSVTNYLSLLQGNYIPGTTSPGTTSPGTTSPGTTSPGTTSPGTTSPGTTSPGTTYPGTTSPGTTLPGTTSSNMEYQMCIDVTFSNFDFTYLKYNDISGAITNAFYQMNKNIAGYLTQFDNSYSDISANVDYITDLSKTKITPGWIAYSELRLPPNQTDRVTTIKTDIDAAIANFYSSFTSASRLSRRFLNDIAECLIQFITNLTNLHTAITNYYILTLSKFSPSAEPSSVTKSSNDYENTCKCIANIVFYYKECVLNYVSNPSSSSYSLGPITAQPITTSDPSRINCTNITQILNILNVYRKNSQIFGNGGATYSNSILMSNIVSALKGMSLNMKKIVDAKITLFNKYSGASNTLLSAEYSLKTSNHDENTKIIDELSNKLLVWNTKFSSMNTSMHHKIYETIQDISGENINLYQNSAQMKSAAQIENKMYSFQTILSNSINAVYYRVLIYAYFVLLILVGYILFYTKPGISFTFKIIICIALVLYPFYFSGILQYLYKLSLYYYNLIVGIPNTPVSTNQGLLLPTMRPRPRFSSTKAPTITTGPPTATPSIDTVTTSPPIATPSIDIVTTGPPTATPSFGPSPPSTTKPSLTTMS